MENINLVKTRSIKENNKMKRKYPLFLSTALLFGVVTASTSCSLLNKIFNSITDSMGISLAETSKTCVVGQTFILKVYITDDDGNKREYNNFESYSFWSTDTEVAEVEGGTGFVTCKKAGTCVINYNALGVNSSAIGCTVTVQEKQLTNLKINRFKTKYPVGITKEELRNKLDYSATAVYQNGYEEAVTPNININSVNTSIIGEYPIYFEYTLGTVTKRVDKVLEIAEAADIDDRIELERKLNDYTKNSFVPVTGLPNKGAVKELVIPIKFTDSNKWISNYNNVKEDINKIFFSSDPETDLGGFESVKTYYEKESRVDGVGSLDAGVTITGTVSDWYSDKYSSEVYLKDKEEMTDTEKLEATEYALQKRAVDWYFETTHEDRKSYDVDGDGFLDAACFVYARPDYQGLGVSKNNYWYHVASNSSQYPNVDNPQMGRRLWTSYLHMYSTRSILQERAGKSDSIVSTYTFEEFPGAKLSARTYIHETGHMFGLDDYYSYTSSDSFASGNTMQTNNVGGHDPYSLLLLNWAKPHVPTESTTITIGDIQRTHDVVLLSPDWNTTTRSPFEEYILLELFAPTGLNAYDSTKGERRGDFSTVGLRIWHVDSRLAKYSSGSFDNTTTYADPLAGGKYSFVTDNSPGSPMSEELESFDKYQQLYLIRNNKTMTYKETSVSMETSDYFVAGDVFNFNDYKKQFVESSTLNNGKAFNWSVSVDSVYIDGTGYGATLTLTKST